ncbi:hypothetical protein [Bowmanella sp. JS7-9]|uniref:Uncharacterized protein n=1 Tax=Pseudobowmanella zhangzhouensis TaxID=1537679 RepID=A0ABW1XJT7_9ALTE|nr:hypothetical protein [Bowmanella sp. JS7-9]TBX22526.1 hypothetical protein TK45_08765 [Bowmanella sp. JS7-9]
MFIAILISLISAVYFYVQAFKHALSPKRWALAGLLGGPFLLPLFKMQKHMAWRRVAGFENAFLRA